MIIITENSYAINNGVGANPFGPEIEITDEVKRNIMKPSSVKSDLPYLADPNVWNICPANVFDMNTIRNKGEIILIDGCNLAGLLG